MPLAPGEFDQIVSAVAERVRKTTLPGSNMSALSLTVGPQAQPVVFQTGDLKWWLGTVPSLTGEQQPQQGWLLPNGATISRTTYANLLNFAQTYGLLGTVFGNGDGTTTFTLPDMLGRGLWCVGAHADVAAIGDTDGLAAASRTPKHHHTYTRPSTTTPLAGGATSALNATAVSDTSGGTPLDAPAYYVAGLLVKF